MIQEPGIYNELKRAKLRSRVYHLYYYMPWEHPLRDELYSMYVGDIPSVAEYEERVKAMELLIKL